MSSLPYNYTVLDYFEEIYSPHATDPNIWRFSSKLDCYFSHDICCANLPLKKCTTLDKCFLPCSCSACSPEMNDVDSLYKNYENKHCGYCKCRLCVCPLRQQSGKYEKRVIKPHIVPLCECKLCQ